jgi:thiamine-monophosphate kinase
MTCDPAISARAAMAAKLGEFERIARFFAPLAAPGGRGLADDVAVIDGPDGEEYVLKTDAIVEGIHFLPNDPPELVAKKLLRVNLSDLAGKGAAPVGYLLMTSLPQARDDAWLAAFAAGLSADQLAFGIGLLGGDSTATDGPVTLSATVIGRVPRGRTPRRSDAKPGDFIYVSGTLGDAALGLLELRGKLGGLDGAHRAFLAQRYRLPEPRLTLGQRLLGIAHAMMDISDGLVADLGHICETSGVGARIEAAALPLSPAARAALAAEPERLGAVLGGGDDYELLLTVPDGKAAALPLLAVETGVPLTRIGRIEAGSAITVLDARGQPMPVAVAGYRHF